MPVSKTKRKNGGKGQEPTYIQRCKTKSGKDKQLNHQRHYNKDKKL